MEYIFADHPDFEGLYYTFAEDNDNLTPLYSKLLYDYQKIYGNNIVDDRSFFIVVDSKPAAFVQLFVENINEKRCFSFCNGYLRAPAIHSQLDDKFKKKILNNCMLKIDELAQQNDIVVTRLALDPLSKDIEFNYLMTYDYLDSSINTFVVDLTQSEETLWSNLRKRFKPLINKGLRTYDVEIYDYTNPSREMHELYRALHHKCSGRMTRSLETFDIQFDMLKKDNSVLIGLKKDDKYLVFSYFTHSASKVYYASSSDDPDIVTDVPLEHTVMWSAMKYYKARGFKLFEVGWQQFGQQFFDKPSQKDITISFFKRGFGGKVLPLFRGIKYYDVAFRNAELEKNLKQLIES